MKDIFGKDFNSMFWKIFGVNNRVYQPYDAINIKRDKQADEKIYNNYLSNNDLLSNENFALHKSKEVDNFFQLFVSLTNGNNHSKFYTHQICNIIYNFTIFRTIDLKYNYKNLFAFQIALIMEYMNHHNFDTELFDASMKGESVMPFIDFSKDNNHISTNKELAHLMCYTLDEMLLEAQKQHQTNIKPVSETTFQKNLSKWKNGVELPSFINVLVITNTLLNTKQTRDKRIAFLFQLLLARGLLHIKTTFNIDADTANSFLTSYQKFRKQIKSELESNNVTELKTKYLLNISENIDTEKPLSESINIIYEKFKEFCKNYFNDDELIQINFPNKDKITNLFNEKKYQEALNLINFKEASNELEQIAINQANYFIKFVISIKLQDMYLMKQSFKEFDRHVLGNLLSFADKDTKYSSQKYIEALKNSHSLVDCINDIESYIKINYQL